MAVDIYGYPSELEDLQRLCTRHELVLIDDACEALGARYRDAPVGARGTGRSVRLLPEQADHDG